MPKEALKNVLQDLAQKKGYIKPHDLVEVARPEDSPVHDLFEWDDSLAAENYRLWQARHLIASVKVEYDGEKTDAYYSVKIDYENRAYVTAEKVFTEKDLYSQVIADALDEIEYWSQKYQEIKELTGIVDTGKITAIRSELSKA